MPFYIQLLKGISPDKAGLIIFPGALGMSITASFSGRLSDKYGEKPFVILGLIIILISSFLFSLFDEKTTIVMIIAVLMLHGLGMGIWGTPNSSQTVSIVPKNTYGSVAALINLIRTVGMGISIAISSSLITLSFINLGLNSDFAVRMCLAIRRGNFDSLDFKFDNEDRSLDESVINEMKDKGII